MLGFMAYHGAHMDVIVFSDQRAFSDVGMVKDRGVVADDDAFFNRGVSAYFDMIAYLAFGINYSR